MVIYDECHFSQCDSRASEGHGNKFTCFHDRASECCIDRYAVARDFQRSYVNNMMKPIEIMAT